MSIWKIITEVMSMPKKLPKRGLPPMHPGELLREEILPALGRPKTEIARLLGVSRQTLYDILEERQPVTPMMALRLGKLCGNGPELWLNLQKRYDLQRAERKLGERINAIPTLEVA
jgi:addiction module HigA family antidote